MVVLVKKGVPGITRQQRRNVVRLLAARFTAVALNASTNDVLVLERLGVVRSGDKLPSRGYAIPERWNSRVLCLRHAPVSAALPCAGLSGRHRHPTALLLPTSLPARPRRRLRSTPTAARGFQACSLSNAVSTHRADAVLPPQARKRFCLAFAKRCPPNLLRRTPGSGTRNMTDFCYGAVLWSRRSLHRALLLTAVTQ